MARGKSTSTSWQQKYLYQHDQVAQDYAASSRSPAVSRNRSEGVVAVILLPTDERYVEISLREGREMRLKRSSCREDSQAARRYGGARHTLIALRTPPALAGASL